MTFECRNKIHKYRRIRKSEKYWITKRIKNKENSREQKNEKCEKYHNSNNNQLLKIATKQ